MCRVTTRSSPAILSILSVLSSCKQLGGKSGLGRSMLSSLPISSLPPATFQAQVIATHNDTKSRFPALMVSPSVVVVDAKIESKARVWMDPEKAPELFSPAAVALKLEKPDLQVVYAEVLSESGVVVLLVQPIPGVQSAGSMVPIRFIQANEFASHAGKNAFSSVMTKQHLSKSTSVEIRTGKLVANTEGEKKFAGIQQPENDAEEPGTTLFRAGLFLEDGSLVGFHLLSSAQAIPAFELYVSSKILKNVFTNDGWNTTSLTYKHAEMLKQRQQEMLPKRIAVLMQPAGDRYLPLFDLAFRFALPPTYAVVCVQNAYIQTFNQCHPSQTDPMLATQVRLLESVGSHRYGHIFKTSRGSPVYVQPNMRLMVVGYTDFGGLLIPTEARLLAFVPDQPGANDSYVAPPILDPNNPTWPPRNLQGRERNMPRPTPRLRFDAPRQGGYYSGDHIGYRFPQVTPDARPMVTPSPNDLMIEAPDVGP